MASKVLACLAFMGHMLSKYDCISKLPWMKLCENRDKCNSNYRGFYFVSANWAALLRCGPRFGAVLRDRDSRPARRARYWRINPSVASAYLFAATLQFASSPAYAILGNGPSGKTSTPITSLPSPLAKLFPNKAMPIPACLGRGETQRNCRCYWHGSDQAPKPCGRKSLLDRSPCGCFLGKLRNCR